MADEGDAMPPFPDSTPDLTFEGGRFDVPGFPLDGITELAKYQKLVLEMAKQIWTKSNRGKSLPGGIIDQVRLRLIDIQPGSQKTYFAGDDTITFPGNPTLRDLTEQAIHRLFADIVQSDYGALEDASPGVVTAARAIASGFSEDETIAVRPERPDEVKYGLFEHRALLKALRGLRYERTGTLVGVLNNLESANKFSLVDGQGRSIAAKFSDTAVWAALHTLHNQQADADLIWIDCDYMISEHDGTVLSIDEVREANLFGKSVNSWAVRLAKFAALPEGHADGEGDRTEVSALLAALEVLDSISDSGWAEPAIFPALDGGVRMEWLTDHQHTVLTVDNDVNFYGFHLNDESDEEAIDEPVGVRSAVAFVERFIK